MESDSSQDTNKRIKPETPSEASESRLKSQREGDTPAAAAGDSSSYSVDSASGGSHHHQDASLLTEGPIPPISSKSATPADDSRPPSTDSASNVQAAASSFDLPTSKCVVHKDLSSVKLYVSSIRHDTEGDGQGDHATTYKSFIISAVSTIDFIGVRNAANAMEALCQYLLKDFDAAKLPQKPAVLTGNDRRRATALLSGDADLQKRVNYSLKRDKLQQLGNYTAEVADFMLSQIQRQELTTCFSKGRQNKKHNEANISKQAPRALFALDMLCQLLQTQDAKKFTGRLEQTLHSLEPLRSGSGETEEQHFMRYGIDVIKRYAGHQDDERIMSPDLLKDKLTHIAETEDLTESERIARQKSVLRDMQQQLLGLSAKRTDEQLVTNLLSNISASTHKKELMGLFQLEESVLSNPSDITPLVVKKVISTAQGISGASADSDPIENVLEKFCSDNSIDTGKFPPLLSHKQYRETNMIGKLIGDLFDYRQDLVFDLKEAIKFTEKDKREVASKKQEFMQKHQYDEDKANKAAERSQLLKKMSTMYFTRPQHDIVYRSDDQFEDTMVKVKRCNADDLLKILGVHYKVMLSAFPALQCEENSKYFNSAFEAFVKEEVLVNQGWHTLMGPFGEPGAHVNLNAAYILAQLPMSDAHINVEKPLTPTPDLMDMRSTSPGSAQRAALTETLQDLSSSPSL